MSTKKKRREFTPEFKAEAVKLVLEEGLSRAQVARDLGLSASMVCRWLEQAERNRAPGALTSEERAELKRLRRENKVLRTEREILKNHRRNRLRSPATCGQETPPRPSVRMPGRRDRKLFGDSTSP